MSQFIFMLFLWWLVHLIWPDKKKGKGARDEGDNYIILSELGQDYGEHNNNTGSIYDESDGDEDW